MRGGEGQDPGHVGQDRRQIGQTGQLSGRLRVKRAHRVHRQRVAPLQWLRETQVRRRSGMAQETSNNFLFA